jgi:hypothetical protein
LCLIRVKALGNCKTLVEETKNARACMIHVCMICLQQKPTTAFAQPKKHKNVLVKTLPPFMFGSNEWTMTIYTPLYHKSRGIGNTKKSQRLL